MRNIDSLRLVRRLIVANLEPRQCGGLRMRLRISSHQGMFLHPPRGDNRDSNLFANVNRTIGRRSMILSRVWWGRKPTKQSVLALLFPY